MQQQMRTRAICKLILIPLYLEFKIWNIFSRDRQRERDMQRTHARGYVPTHARNTNHTKGRKPKPNEKNTKSHKTFCCSKPIRQSDAEQVTFFGDDNPRQKHFVVRKYCFSFQPDGDDRFQASIGITGAETSDLFSTEMDPNPSENRADLLLMPRIKWSASSLRGTGRRVYAAMQTTGFPLKNIMIADG